MLTGLLSSQEKECNDEIINRYFKKYQQTQAGITGVDKFGLFRMICEINGIEVPEDMFVWQATLNEIPVFTNDD